MLVLGRRPNFGIVRTFLPLPTNLLFGLAVRLGIAALIGNTIGSGDYFAIPGSRRAFAPSTGPVPQRPTGFGPTLTISGERNAPRWL
jgi:hypothetical protein